jgi:hypothetical protein
MVRNAIDIDRWTKRNDHSRYLPTIGWVGAVPWRSNDLESVSPFLGEFIANNKLAFHHSGHIKGTLSADKRIGVPPGTKVTYSERMLLSKYPSMFKKIDIGIVPLNDIEFNYAKSGIKGLEYVASGVPYVASWSPEYEYLEDLGIGRVAKNSDEWIHHMTELQDPKVRKEDVERNYENVLLTQTMEVRGAEWDKTMKDILNLELS